MIHLLRPLRLGEDGTAWEHWLPPPGHPAHGTLRLLEATDESRDYRDQVEIQHRLAGGRPVRPLPPLVILQSALGAEVITVTTWKAGKPLALPKAD